MKVPGGCPIWGSSTFRFFGWRSERLFAISTVDLWLDTWGWVNAYDTITTLGTEMMLSNKSLEHQQHTLQNPKSEWWNFMTISMFSWSISTKSPYSILKIPWNPIKSPCFIGSTSPLRCSSRPMLKPLSSGSARRCWKSSARGRRPVLCIRRAMVPTVLCVCVGF